MRTKAKYAWIAFCAVLAMSLMLGGSALQVPSGTWQATSSMSEARDGAAAVGLPDGRVLVIGGDNGNGATASVDVFTATGAFSSGPNMLTARSGHTATLLSDGRVLVVGGTTAGGAATASAEIYDPASDSWSNAASLGEARSGAVAVALENSQVLVAGGVGVKSIEIYDEASNSWSNAGNMSVARANAAAAVLGRWPGESNRLIDRQVIIVGGSSAGATHASTDVYDMKSGEISAGPALPGPRKNASAVTVLGGSVYVAGGNDGSSDLSSAVLISRDGVVSNAPSLLAARSGHFAVRLPGNNSALIAGGSAGASAEIFVPWTGQQVATGAPAAGHVGGASASVSRGLYLVAGGDGSGSSEVYGYATVDTDKNDYSPGETVIASGSGWQAGESVTLVLHEDLAVPFHGDLVVDAVADQNGDIHVPNLYLVEDHDFGIRFFLTAAGSVSGHQARATFTDAASADLDQCRNGDSDTPTGVESVDCKDSTNGWVNGNVGEQNAHMAEGLSIPYRARMEEVPANSTVDIWLSYDTKHSDKVAIDHLTHFQCLEPHLQFGHAAEVVDPSDTFGGYSLPPDDTFPIPEPDFLNAPAGAPGFPDFTGSLNDCTRTMSIWGGDITDIQYNPDEQLTGEGESTFADGVNQATTFIRIRFTTGACANDKCDVLLAWGGHIASRVDWGFDADGVPRSAGGISGSPYHMRLESWHLFPVPPNANDDLPNLGNQDRSLSAAAVIPTGTIKIIKNAIPDSAQDFSFTASGTGAISPGTFDLDDDANVTLSNMISFTVLSGNTFTFTELGPPSGWTLTTRACQLIGQGLTPNMQSVITTPGSDQIVVELNDGEDIECTFTNTGSGNIIVDKVTEPSGDPQSFDFDAQGGVYQDFSLTDAAAPNDQSLIPGTYTVSETVPSGWDLISAVCDDDDSTDPTGMVLDPGETIHCTFTNRKRGSIIIVKNTVGGNDTFSYSRSFGANFDLTTVANTDSETFSNLQAGAYTVTELGPPATWAFTSLVCEDGVNGTIDVVDSTEAGQVASINLDPGETVRCTYTNTKGGTIIVKKVMIGGTDTFNYTGDVAGSISVNNGTLDEDVAPGSYSSVEGVPPAGWALYSIACDDSDSTGDVPTRTASFEVDPGETVTCTFTNIKPDAQIDLSPLTATNEVNDAHTITATVQQDDMLASGEPGGDSATGFGPAPDGTLVTFSLLNNTAGASFVGGVNTCNTTGGSCSVQINTSTAGSVDIHATTTFSVLSVSLTRATGTGGLNSDDANKVYVDAQIDLTPLEATNPINQAHTITATVQQDDGIPAGAPGDGATGFGPAPDGTLVTFSLLNNTAGAAFVGGVNTCNTTAGSCSVQINTSTPGGVDIHATTTFSVGGVSLTRSTGSGGLNSADAHKDYVAGKIIVIKECEPALDPQLFTFAGPGAIDEAQLACFTNGNTNTVDSGFLAPGNYEVSETVPAGWDLTQITCNDDDNSGGLVDIPAVDLVLQADETITCTFHNVKQAKIVIRKINLGRGPAFPIFGYFGSPELPDAMATIGTVNNSPVAPHANADFSLQTTDGATDTNQCLGIFNASQFATAECKGEAMISGVAPGQQSFFEQQPNSLTWRLIELVCDDQDAVTSINDTDGVVNDTPAKGGRVDIDLEPGQTLTCTFVNQFGGRIRVVKQTDPAGSAQSFDYATNYLNPGPANFSLTDADAGDGNDTDINTAPPSPNNLSDWQPPNPDADHYMVTETVPAGWDLDSISCYVELGPNAGNSVGVVDLGNGKVTVPLSGGQIIRCTFDNTQRGKITIVKEVSFGDITAVFPFDAVGGTDPAYADFSLDVNPATAGILDMNMQVLKPGSYSAQELISSVQGGTWEIDFVNHPADAISCTADGGSSFTITGASVGATDAYQKGDDQANIDLGANGDVTCTFINRSGGKIRIIKACLPDPDDPTNGMFNFTATYVNGDTTPGPLECSGSDPTNNNAVNDTLSLWQPVFDNTTGELYTVGENLADLATMAPGYSLSGISCVVEADAANPGNVGSSVGTVDLVAGDVDLQLFGGQILACTFTNTLEVNEGCTPGFWKNHSGLGNGPQTNAWPAAHQPGDLLTSVWSFANCATLNNNSKFTGATLFQALSFKGGSGVEGAAQILLRAAVAALLNASSDDVDYPLSEAQVISMVQTALDSCDRNTMLALAGDLDEKNNLGCPINGRSTGVIVGTMDTSAPAEVPDTSGTTNTSSFSQPASKPIAATDNPVGLGLGVFPTATPSATPETAEKELSQITSVKLTGNQVEVSGRVVDASGVVGITFALYSEKDGGSPLWLETRNVELDEEGRYTVRITLPTELGSLESHWLGAQVQGQVEARIVLR